MNTSSTNGQPGSGNFLNNLKTRTKLYAGFGTLLVLLAGLGATSWLAAERGGESLDAYTTQSSIASSISDAEIYVLEARLAVRRFLESHSDADVTAFEERWTSADSSFAEAKTRMTLPENIRAIEDIQEIRKSYAGSFRGIIEKTQREQGLEVEILNELGAKVRKVLTELRMAEIANGNSETIVKAAQAGESFLLARVVAARFLSTNDKAEVGRVAKELGDVERQLGELVTLPLAPGQAERIAEAREMLTRYGNGFTEVAALTLDNREVVDRMAKTILDLQRKTDDIRAASEEKRATVRSAASDQAASVKTTVVVFCAIALTLGLALAWLIARGIAVPVTAMTSAMRRLADGDTDVAVPAVGRKDEIGQMAGAVEIFKDNMIRGRQMEREAKEAEVRAAADRKAAMTRLADSFEASVKGIVETVASAATEMRGTASVMTHTADMASGQATAVAAASEQASANVQTVAAATEELSSSIAEIGRQITNSSQIASQAVTEAERTTATMRELVQAAEQIGQVVELINTIAGQTNLLALNATIEAARAGEAGKGFAVVASEVKSLATQTARATEEIKSKVGEIQGATGGAQVAIDGIGTIIGQMNEITTAIAAAIEEQSAATRDIATNVSQASRGTDQVSSNITGVTQAVGETGAAASEVLGASEGLAREAERLRTEVANFIATVRAA
ncbi:hypothetical protein N825_31875 [Skermanella stibiiresistens SB22]|uniref:Methyl-accepting chemotaxis protein n=1 Tax=Skermanella stibiiresistens SB22 TaxID=1385369 RepID=W9GX08_9PROT|nr:HAMP domain-containing methyl-accepting chemotaxis protein [Skermanella stibiiresistens]EWY36023.1 hypothetical protein N825_31875 [Skermanella stibiiresistens SB22]